MMDIYAIGPKYLMNSNLTDNMLIHFIAMSIVCATTFVLLCGVKKNNVNV